MQIKTPDQRAAPRKYWHIPSLPRIEDWLLQEIDRLGGPIGAGSTVLLRVMEYLASNPGLEPEDLEVFRGSRATGGQPAESPRDATAYHLAGGYWLRPTEATWDHVQENLAHDRARRVKRLKRGKQSP